MKKFLLLLTMFTVMTNCSVSKKPVFKYIDDIKVKNVSLRNVTFSADAIFENPNHINGTLSVDDIHVFVDNIDVGTLSSKEFDVVSKGEFTIPLEGTFSLSKIYKKNKNNLLENVLKMAQTDSILIEYKGVIRYHLGSFSYPYKVNTEQKIRLK